MTPDSKTSAAIVAIAFAASSGAAFGDQQNGSATQGSAQPQGLYSADQLLDAEVHSTASNQEVGEIEDILFNNDMSIESFAVQTESSFGLGGKSYVVTPSQISVRAQQGDQATEPEYRVMLDADAEELRQNPVYSDSWWNKTQTQARQAWETTKDTASSAWTNIKEGTANLVNDADKATDAAADQAGDAADATADSAQNAADETGDAADDAAN